MEVSWRSNEGLMILMKGSSSHVQSHVGGSSSHITHLPILSLYALRVDLAHILLTLQRSYADGDDSLTRHRR